MRAAQDLINLAEILLQVVALRHMLVQVRLAHHLRALAKDTSLLRLIGRRWQIRVCFYH